jgi:beta-galactosidase/beta-glucuronidase
LYTDGVKKTTKGAFPMMTIPRPEHPQPQFQRNSWQNLNGPWQFCFDFGNSGLDQKYYESGPFDRDILVPFCPESELSGIQYTDFMSAVWYQRTIELTAEQLRQTVRLHFGAVDYECQVFINGQFAGQHLGGYASFHFDITAFLTVGENKVTVYAKDEPRSGQQPTGKQSKLYASHGCDYTRTTGIWQTVWLEFLPEAHLESVKYYPNVADRRVTLFAKTQGVGKLTATISYQGRECGKKTVTVTTGTATLDISLTETHLWETGHGRLYDVVLTFNHDQVMSYFGLREVQMEGYVFKLNGKSVFQRLVLDQGFYPDGIYTAPTDEALKQDIELSLAAGFNGARLHEKAFEPRFLYHCDQAGYLVWGEMANWGLDYSRYQALPNFIPEWQEIIARDFNHPAIVTWCPFNESWDYAGRPQRPEMLAMLYHITKQLDETRPVVDTSGNYHVLTDIYDVHDYAQDPTVFKEHFTPGAHANGEFYDEHHARQQYTQGLPYCVSEYGGIKWDTTQDTSDSWGYGEGPKTEQEFLERYRGLTDVLLQHEKMFGFCYTQLYDVEQEKNGLYTYNRTPKFEMTLIKQINQQKARIEE